MILLQTTTGLFDPPQKKSRYFLTKIAGEVIWPGRKNRPGSGVIDYPQRSIRIV